MIYIPFSFGNFVPCLFARRLHVLVYVYVWILYKGAANKHPFNIHRNVYT